MPPSHPVASLDWKWFLPLLITIALNAGGTLWWAATMESRVTVVEQALTAIQSSRPVNLDRLTRVESTAADVKERLNRIEGKLDAVISRTPN